MTGMYSISATHESLAALAFVGKFIGCLSAGGLIERIGHRKTLVLMSIISYIGIISELRTVLGLPEYLSTFAVERLIHDVASVEMTSAGAADGTGRYFQFIGGRIVVYMSIGLVEVTVS